MRNNDQPNNFATPTDEDVIWFGASRRLIGGKPDSRYGWLEHADGPCIVKALDSGLTAYAGTLLQHERAMLCRLRELDAPAPALVEVGRDDWLVTRFGGLSIQLLEQRDRFDGVPAPQRFPFGERLAAWAYMLRRLQTMADKGVLPIDLYGANVVLPLTGRTHGQLRLNEAALIDHAHTLEAGMNMRRPVWLNRGMERIPPELRAALKQDQETLIDTFRARGADLPGYSRMPDDKDAFNRLTWAEYDAPQQLQKLLDEGSLSCDHAMQFAAGTDLLRPLPLAGQTGHRHSLAKVLARMTAAAPSERYPTLTDASEALAGLLEQLPRVSQHGYGPVCPEDLALPADSNDDMTTLHSPLGPLSDNTVIANQSSHTILANCVAMDLPHSWLYAAAAIGAALGSGLRLPW